MDCGGAEPQLVRVRPPTAICEVTTVSGQIGALLWPLVLKAVITYSEGQTYFLEAASGGRVRHETFLRVNLVN